MEFENFNGTDECGKSERVAQLENVRVSESSRRDAKPVRANVEDFEDEYNRLNARVHEIDGILATQYSRNVYAKEQIRCRKVVGGVGFGSQKNKAFDDWIAVRTKLDSERCALIESKNVAQKRMQAIKQKAKDQKLAREAAIRDGAKNRPLEPTIAKLVNAVDRMVAVLERVERLL